MIIYFMVSAMARIFMPHDAVLVNQKLKGYWVVVEDNRPDRKITDSLTVIRFSECDRKDRKDKLCEYSRLELDRAAITDFKLAKPFKKNWRPQYTNTYWVEKKINKETKRETIHIEGFSEISFHLLKKEVELFSGDSMVVKIRKLK
ncbi:MAG: hypothetical protein KDC79_00700 [Cyclobacteriaceae bacterium]|nr:hypothetical protein [Cyclobacteriaceae bacterium]